MNYDHEQKPDGQLRREDGILAQKLALLFLESRRRSLPVRDYVGSVLPGLANLPINRVAELTPSAWAARI